MPEESTSPDLVDMIRRVFETFSRGDLEASISFFSPDAVWEGIDVAVGRAQIRALWGDYARSAADLQIDLTEVVDYGHGVLLALTNHTGHPQGSNYDVRAHEAYVYQCSVGLIDHVTAYPDVDEGRAAAERLAEERGAISQQRVALVHALVERWNAGERNLGAIGDAFDPAVELDSPLSSVVGVPYRGHAGIEQWRHDIDEQFSEWHLHLDDLRDLGDAVIVIGSVRGRGRVSGVVVEFDAAVLATFAGGHRITRMRIYLDIQEALQAAGLTE